MLPMPISRRAIRTPRSRASDIDYASPAVICRPSYALRAANIGQVKEKQPPH